MRGWAKQLWSVVRSRQGGGALLIAVFGAVALGVVPNVLQSWTDSVWAFGAVFVVCVALAIVGWALTRDRGLGVVVAWYPPEQNTDSWVQVLKSASRSAHSSTLVIDRGALRADRYAGLDRQARADLVFRLLDARLTEYLEAGGAMGDVAVYPSAQVSDAFLLGRALRYGSWPSLRLMHSSRAHGRGVVPGPELSSALLEPISTVQLALIAPSLAPAPPAEDGLVVANPGAPQAVRHRLALVVRLASLPSMVDDARYVALSGRVVREGDGRHTGYVLDETDPRAPGDPCGACVIVDTGDAYLPERPDVFEAMVMHIRERWRVAQREWSAQVGRSARGVLFYHGPISIAIALGWLLGEEMDIVHHEMALIRSARKAVA